MTQISQIFYLWIFIFGVELVLMLFPVKVDGGPPTIVSVSVSLAVGCRSAL
jgi:hypothetical protein